MARPELQARDRVVVKIGTASLVGPTGEPDDARLAAFAQSVTDLQSAGLEVIVVSSGAIAAGLGPLEMDTRPSDIPSLQAAAAVGQGRLLRRYTRTFDDLGVVSAQILLTRHDFMHRQQYLNARNTLDRLLALGVVPIVNENDTVAIDEISFGDNDRLAALVANLTHAKLLVLLTNTKGVHAADPKRHPDAPLLDEVEVITPELERAAGGRGSDLSSGGMASKLTAAWVATFSGVGVIVADATEPNVLRQAVSGEKVGTYFHPRRQRGIGAQVVDRVRPASARPGRSRSGRAQGGDRGEEKPSSGRSHRRRGQVPVGGHGRCRGRRWNCFRQRIGTLQRPGVGRGAWSIDGRARRSRGHSQRSISGAKGLRQRT